MFDLLMLADGATAPVPTVPAAGWFSEEGITAMVSMLVTVLTVVKLLLERTGRLAEAQKVAAGVVAIEKGATTLGAVVGAIAELRRTGELGPAQAQALLGKIKATTSMLEVDKVLDAIVQSEKAAPAPPGAAPLAAVEAAKAVLVPPEPTAQSILRRITGRVS